ncbi:MAG: MarR family transcriptional regulator [Parvibaculaceae bacterium]|nr:MarR family transcriptional regulator [Parvibaculaceae bacterium]
MAEQPGQKTGDGLALDEFLCFSIYSAGHAFNQVYRPLLDEIGLTYPQYLLMVALWSKDEQTVKALGQALYLESNTLTPMLKRLEGLGYVARTRDPEDERQLRVCLTDQGRALRARAAAIPPCILEAMDISRDDLDRIQAGISTIRDHLLAHEH